MTVISILKAYGRKISKHEREEREEEKEKMMLNI